MPELTNSLPKWALAAIASLFAGCSIHPIPDDVSRYDTAEIVRNVRCEAKEAVRERIQEALYKRGIYHVNPEKVLQDTNVFNEIRRRDPILAAKFKAYGVSLITYDFDFHITEHNKNSGSLNFGMPITPGGNFSLLLDGQFDKTRDGQRTFKTAETFEDLAKLRCDDWTQPERNMAYPLTGSIGVSKIITTFINISEQGSLDNSKSAKQEENVFKDVIKFTTKISGTINPTLKLDPVPDRFRLTNATINKSSDRDDIHQVTITLLFPNLERVRGAVSTMAKRELVVESEIRALENNCVAIERAREERFGVLRRTPPEIYCRYDYGVRHGISNVGR